MTTLIQYDLADIFNPLNFPYFADTTERAQFKINRFARLADEFRAAELTGSVKNRKALQVRQVLINERDVLAASLEVLRQKLSATEEADILVPLMDAISVRQRQLQKIDDRLSMADFSENGIRNQIAQKHREMLANALEAGVVTYCEWISAGHLGPGSVSFKGVIYTAD
ncbi:hypothetical protein [Persicobacter diffluens]|uniref:Uncharacterized protein n=1 Tax=Persicobacter diffluens TaxID=981 RepID=A0AAN4W415_9BACT|nr:hypothetical protein PEDI_44540 [Persicobacter diffluens]